MENEQVIKLICWLLAILFSIVSSIIGLVKGKNKKKTSNKLTQAEQENDLFNYMVEQTIQVERFSKLIKNSMSKEELSKYKRDTVLNNITLYAQANGYSWYNSGVWADNLTKYIENANASAGVTHTPTPNVG